MRVSSYPATSGTLYAHLGRRQPPRHAGELMSAFFWMVREEAFVAHQGYLDGLKDSVAEVVDELHHFRVMITRVKDGRDAEEDRLLHAEEWNHYLAD